jgi:predicted small lipoprotein YifL
MIRVGAVLACLLLAACGLKGDLYMPDTARPVVVPATAAPATGEAAADEDDDADQTPQQQGAAGNAANN